MPNRPFAQLLPGLETGHPVTVGQSPAYDFSVSDEQKAVFLPPFRTVLSAIRIQVTDQPSPDALSLTQAIIVQMVYCSSTKFTLFFPLQPYPSQAHFGFYAYPVDRFG